MKKLLTVKFSVINTNSVNTSRGGSNNIEKKGRKKKKKKEMKTLLIIPIIGAISLYFKPSKQWALLISVATMIEALRLYVIMDKKSTEYQLVEKIVWETKEIAFGLDGISINFVVLTTILIPICILVS